MSSFKEAGSGLAIASESEDIPLPSTQSEDIPLPTQARVGAAAEASFSPGGQTWYEGMKGPELKGPLKAPIGESLKAA